MNNLWHSLEVNYLEWMVCLTQISSGGHAHDANFQEKKIVSLDIGVALICEAN